MTNFSHGLPSAGVRLHETQPLLRDRDVLSPLYLDRGRIALRPGRGIAKLSVTASDADRNAKINEIIDVLRDQGVLEP